jgi:hypothetical protein
MYVQTRKNEKVQKPDIKRKKKSTCAVVPISFIHQSIHPSTDQCCFFQNLVTIHCAPNPNFFILSPLLLPLDFRTRKK